MVEFKTLIEKFSKQGEKTGWTYIVIPSDIAEQINPGVKKSFRIKGKLDAFEFSGMNVLPMGEGNFILALNADIRRTLRKKKGDSLQVKIALDPSTYQLNKELLLVLESEPKAISYFKSLPLSHQNYFSKWIESAKSENTRQDRIVATFEAMLNKLTFAQMLKTKAKREGGV